MSTYTDFTDSLFDQIVASIETVEDRALAAVSSGNTFAKRLLPTVAKVEEFGAKYYPPARSFPIVGKLPALPKAADRLADDTAFAQRTIKAQADAARKLVDRIAPDAVKAATVVKTAPVAKVAPTVSKPRTAAATKPVAAKKSVAKRVTATKK